jgi:hypothetical protein
MSGIRFLTASMLNARMAFASSRREGMMFSFNIVDEN